MREKENLTIKTVKQARRLVKTVIGFTIILIGVIMLVTPGPGIAAIVGGLAILATEFVWAKRLLNRFGNEANNLKNSIFNSRDKNKSKL